MPGYSARTHVAPGDLGTAADDNQGMDNEAALWPFTVAGQIPVASSASALAAKIPGWNPDSPPASPNANDDEFEDAALAAAWTEYDPDGKTTWSEGPAGLKAVTATLATLTQNGLYRTLPAGDFTIWCKVALLTKELATNSNVGICLWEDPTGDNEQFSYMLGRDNTAGYVMRLHAYAWTNRSTINGSAKLAFATFGYGTSVYLRLRRTGTNYYIDFSNDGLGWRTPNAEAAITLAFTPTKMGLCVLNQNTGANQTALVPFFRYLGSDVGLAGVMEGNRF